MLAALVGGARVELGRVWVVAGPGRLISKEPQADRTGGARE